MSTNKTAWTIYISDENIKKQVKKIAVDMGVPVGDAVTLIIQEWIQFKKENNKE
ncbi:hypothetical protein [Tolypothrix sp. NIES-4075]|uniref:hypothetical protein n=1 Tax=Tolypothrix sp. NIES-4075 TaxID=2005459 RepID=UPI001357D23D|nr:hypothetical protein [Tolypothrix sp. NIES-4075]